jgi:hypothetical protein
MYQQPFSLLVFPLVPKLVVILSLLESYLCVVAVSGEEVEVAVEFRLALEF